LLSNDHEMGGYTRPVSGQRLDKHVPAVRKNGSHTRMSGVVFAVRAEELQRSFGQPSHLTVGSQLCRDLNTESEE
jgi:hypothetical protein